MRKRKTVTKMISLMARQSLRAGRLRNTFVMITIILASAMLTAILLFAMGQSQRTKNALSHSRQVSYYNLTSEQVERITADERISSQVRVKTGILSEEDGFEIMPCYVSELSDEIQMGRLESGNLPREKWEIAVPAELLRRMETEPKTGSILSLAFYDGSCETFTVSGLLEGGEGMKQFTVFLSEIYAEEGSQLKERPYEVYAKLRGAESMGREECREIMYQIGSEAGVERKYVAPSRAFLDSLSVNMQSVSIYGLVGAVIVLACVLVVYGVFYLSVLGRVHQFGQLRTLGMTRGQIKGLVAREGTALFLRAAPVGIAVGMIGGYVMIPDGFLAGNGVLAGGLVFAGIYIVTMISVRKPAKIAASVSPMEALRYVPQESMDRASNKKPCRRLTPVGLGVMNFSRNKKKAAVTMASLALGGILFMTAATYMSSFDTENYARQGDFLLGQFVLQYSQAAAEMNEYGLGGLQAKGALGGETAERIGALEGVEKVTEIKSMGVRFDYPAMEEFGNGDVIYPLTREEVAEIGKYLEEGSADPELLASGDYILAADNKTVEEVYGWRFRPGDSIVLHYFDGGKMAEKQVTILGILNNQYVVDKKGIEGWFQMSGEALEKLAPYDINVNLVVAVDPQKEAEVGEILEQMVQGEPDLSMETLEERKIAYKKTVEQLFFAIRGIAVFIMSFSVLSMMNTLITNIVTRKQELAMLESIGMDKGQIRVMLLGESLLLVAATVGVTMTVGVLCGYWLSNALYQGGAVYMAFRFPGTLALCYTAVLLLVPLVIIGIAMARFAKEALVERVRGTEG